MRYWLLWLFLQRVWAPLWTGARLNANFSSFDLFLHTGDLDLFLLCADIPLIYSIPLSRSDFSLSLRSQVWNGLIRVILDSRWFWWNLWLKVLILSHNLISIQVILISGVGPNVHNRIVVGTVEQIIFGALRYLALTDWLWHRERLLVYVFSCSRVDICFITTAYLIALNFNLVKSLFTIMNCSLDLICQKVVLAAWHHLCLLMLERGCSYSIRVAAFSLACHCLKLVSLSLRVQASIASNLELLRLQKLLLLLLHQQQRVWLHCIELLRIALIETLHVDCWQRFAVVTIPAPLLEVLQASQRLLDIAYAEPKTDLFCCIHTLLDLFQTTLIRVITILMLSLGASVSLWFSR